MTYIVYMMLLLASGPDQPGPTFMVIEGYNTMGQCQRAISTFVRKSGLTPEQSNRLVCTAVITSPLTDPL
jgi:hypothetical protein